MKKYLFLTGLIAATVLATSVWLAAAPSIGTVAAAPAYIIVNTVTDVLFTAHITDPSVIPTGINLLQIDSTGKTIRTIGLMRDNGTTGDATIGDKVFSLKLS